MARKYTKKAKVESENIAETPFVETDNAIENILESPTKLHPVEYEVSIFIATIVNLQKPKRILQIRKYSNETTEKILNAMTSEMTYDHTEGDTLESLKSMQGRKFDFILVSGEDDFKYLTAEFKLVERLISKKGVVIYPNSISSKSIANFSQVM